MTNNLQTNGIIIYTQSLANDEHDDLWMNGQYYRGPFEFSFTKISQKIHQKYALKVDKNSDVRFWASNWGLTDKDLSFYFNVPCEQTDVLGRKTRIEIYVPWLERKKLLENIEKFEQASGRTISQSAKNFLKNYNFSSKKLTNWLLVFGGVAVVARKLCKKKSIKNKESKNQGNK